MRVVILALTTCLLNIPAQAQYSGGSGTADDPYQIAAAADLIALGETPADYRKHFVLTADIDLDPNLPGGMVPDEALIAAPIWHRVTPFAGVLDGNGHTISHLTIKGGGYLGLFGHLASGAEIKNLGLVDVNISGSGGCVGGLVGVSSGTVTECYGTGTVSGAWGVGGLVGDNDDGSVANCYNTGTVGGGGSVGGLVGISSGVVTQCRSTAIVSGASGVGGLVGESRYGTVAACYSTGAVSGNSRVGGLVGWNSGKVTACYSAGAVSGDSRVGGLAGRNTGRVTDCHSAGPVDGADWGIGGLVGDNDDGSVANCYNTGAASGKDRVGGLVGENGEGTVATSYSAGTVTGTGQPVGGLVGGSAATMAVTASFWDIQTSGQATSDGGTGKITTEMQDPNMFGAAGWDFVGRADGPHDIWAEPEGGGYPVLYWQLPAEFGLPRFSGGTGEPNEPYAVSTAAQLNSIGHNPRLMKADFRLIADLDLTGLHFYPIGAPDHSYKGAFDGNGHTISHLTLTGGDRVGLAGYLEGKGGLGLFGHVGSGADIKNLGVLDVNITGWDSFVGALVGRNDGGSVTHCYSHGAIGGDACVGGLVGSNGGDVIACHAGASVRGEGFKVGGLVGLNNGAVAQCYSTGAVNGSREVGGLVGSNRRTVTQCYSSGVVSGGQEIGGLVGLNASIAAVIINCYSTSAVSGMYPVGGLVGTNNSGEVSMCYAAGAVSGLRPVGGLAALNAYNGSVNWCIWDIQNSGHTESAGGAGKTTAEMQMAGTFLAAGWDFVDETANGTQDIWWILEGQDYPRLWWELEDGEIGPFQALRGGRENCAGPQRGGRARRRLQGAGRGRFARAKRNEPARLGRLGVCGHAIG